MVITYHECKFPQSNGFAAFQVMLFCFKITINKKCNGPGKIFINLYFRQRIADSHKAMSCSPGVSFSCVFSVLVSEVLVV